MRGKIVVAIFLFGACKPSGPQTENLSSGGSSGGSTGGAVAGFNLYTVGGISDGNVGLNISAATNGSKLVIGTYGPSPIPSSGTCSIGDGANNPYIDGPLNTYDIWYSEAQVGDLATWTSTIIDTPGYINQNDYVGVGVDSKGKATVAWYGKLPLDEKGGALQCGAGQWVVSQGSGSTFGAHVTIGDQSGGSAGHNMGLIGGVPEFTAYCQGIGAKCDEGDFIGVTPQVAIDTTDQPLFVARDIHNGGSNTTDYSKADIEFMRGIQADNDFFTADVGRGGGSDIRLILLPDGRAAIAYTVLPLDLMDETAGSPGVWVNVEQTKGGDWSIAQVVSSGAIGSGIGFGVNSAGVFSIAYYDGGAQQLIYNESPDGVTWTGAVKVDTTGTTGQYPSLAIDGNDEPAISYYRCSPKVEQTTCDPDSDGLRVARRAAGAWSEHDVSNQSGYTDGINSVMLFIGGKETVVFRNTTFDPSAKVTTGIVQVVQEQ